MKKIKIALFWQIIIALVLAVLYGIFLSPTYKLTQKTFSKLEKHQVDSATIQNLASIENIKYDTKSEFEDSIEKILTSEQYKLNNEQIVQSASTKYISWVSWLGDLFMRALKMIIVPLILTSIISGVTNMGSGENLGRLGLKTMAYYTMTSVFAIVTGLFFVNLIKPGKGADLGFVSEVEGLAEANDSFGSTLLEIIPENFFASLTSGHMLSIIFFAILFGFFITKINDKPRIILTDFFNASFDVMMKITQFIIRFTPLGIFGIVAKVISEQDDLVGLASRLGLYMLVVIMGLAFHGLVTLPLIVKFVGKANPFAHMKAMRNALVTAFSTSSSGATLSLTIDNVRKNSGVSNRISSFTLPLGATVNMDGTALYELVVAMFIAQAYGIEMSIGMQIIAVITALLASIGAAGIPMAGLVMISVVLTAMGLPLEGLGLVLAVDRVLDMFRTTINVWSDSCAAVVIAKSEGEVLKV